MIIDILLGKAEGRGGLEYVLSLVSQELTRRGYRVRVFQSAPPTHLEWADTLPEIYYYDQVAFGEPPSYVGEIDFFRYILGYRSLLAKLGTPEVILVTHVPLFSLVARIATSHLNKERPLLLSWMHASLKMFNGAEVLLQYCDGHLAISSGMAKAIKETLNQQNAPIYPVGNPVDIQSVEFITRPQKVLELLFIGRLSNQEKRLDVLLQALSQVKGDWHLTIIGDGPDANELWKLAVAFGIAGKIAWKGWQENPWSIVKSASVLVLTSQYESFGMILVEALARGIPVLASRCEGPEDIVSEGENGWLFEVGNVGQLQRIIQGIIYGKIKIPTQEVCKESVERFQLQNVVNQLEDVIVQSLSKFGGRGDKAFGTIY